MGKDHVSLHPWLKKLQVAYQPQHEDQVLESAARGLLEAFREQGHRVASAPTSGTDLVLTSAPFGEPVGWREALLFTARSRFDLDRHPTVLTMVHLSREEFQEMINQVESALQHDHPEPEHFPYQGLAEHACRVLHEQGQRGGPILAVERIIQAQTKSIEVLLVVGNQKPDWAFLFNLVGAHPRITSKDRDAFYREIVLRLTTSFSTSEVTDHKTLQDPIPAPVWQNLPSISAMKQASRMFGKRHFFTQMVRIEDLVNVPAVSDVVASQYSEGCFATWDPDLQGLISTVTGSARPVQKDSIEEEDLAVIAGVREDGSGALTRPVAGKDDDPPSSEAVEMIAMDEPLPKIQFRGHEVPVIRSKLHGHRGVRSFNPELVEHVPLESAYYHFPVSCATRAQADGIKDAFSRSEALLHPDDPRQIVFTVLPGHGVVIAEKWVNGKAPFQVLWEAMDAGDLEIESDVPQGGLMYEKQGEKCVLVQGSGRIDV